MTPAIKFSCPSCYTPLKLTGAPPGQKVKCPKCSTVITVPAASAVQQEPPAKQPEPKAQAAPRTEQPKAGTAPPARNPAPAASPAPKPAPAIKKSAPTHQGTTSRGEEYKSGGVPRKAAGTLPSVQLPPEGQKAEAPRRKAAETFPGNSMPADLTADDKPAAPRRLECPVCGGTVRPPLGISTGKPVKCPLCTAVFPMPAGFKAEPVANHAPVEEHRAAPAPSPTVAPAGFAPAASSLAPPPPGEATEEAAQESTSAPAEPSADSPGHKARSAAEPSLTMAWIVFGLSVTLFVGLLVLWRLLESGTINN